MLVRYLLTILLFTPFVLCGQTLSTVSTVRCQTDVEPLSKSLRATITELDPTAQISISGPMVKLRLSIAPCTDQTIETAFQHAGLAGCHRVASHPHISLDGNDPREYDGPRTTESTIDVNGSIRQVIIVQQ